MRRYSLQRRASLCSISADSVYQSASETRAHTLFPRRRQPSSIPPCSATLFDCADAQRVLRREPGAEISRLRGGAGAGASASASSRGGRGGNRPPLPRRRSRFCQAKAGHRAHGYPVLPVVQQLVALCRDGHGEWCHWGATTQDVTDSATVLQDPRGARPGRSGYRRDRRRLGSLAADTAIRRWPGEEPSSRPCRSPSARRWRPSSPRSGATSSASRSCARVLVGEFGELRRHARVARRPRPRRAGGIDARARARRAGDRLAHGAHTIAEAGSFSASSPATAQDRLRREAVDADRGGRGVRAFSPRPRLVVDHAAETQPIGSVYITALNSRRRARRPLCSTPWSRTTSAQPARGIELIVLSGMFCLPPASWCRRGPSWPACRSTKREWARISHHARAHRLRGGDDGAGRHLGRQYAHDLVYDICREVIASGRPLADLLAENAEVARYSTAPGSPGCAIRPIISARPARWSIGRRRYASRVRLAFFVQHCPRFEGCRCQFVVETWNLEARRASESSFSSRRRCRKLSHVGKRIIVSCQRCGG